MAGFLKSELIELGTSLQWRRQGEDKVEDDSQFKAHGTGRM